MLPKPGALAINSGVDDRTTVHIMQVEGGFVGLPELRGFASSYGQRECEVFAVSCDFNCGGPWAGVHDLISAVLPQMEDCCPEVVKAHEAEIANILPARRNNSGQQALTLTDTASDEDKVRNYAADRALRNAHGLIDMLLEWRLKIPAVPPWVIACDAFHFIGAAGLYFFRELNRRIAAKTALTLLLVTDQRGDTSVDRAFGSATAMKIDSAPPGHKEKLTEPADALRMAAEIELNIGDDIISKQIHLPELLRLWHAAGNNAKVIRLKLFGMSRFLHEGLYQDALRYGDSLLEEARKHEPCNEQLHRDIAIKLLNSLMGVNDAPAALRLIHGPIEELTEKASDEWKIDVLYLTAMVYGRFSQPRDFTKGEEYLDKALALIEAASLDDSRRQFLYVFNRNGLAMIRSFQRRASEAIELCKKGLSRLNTYVAPYKHRLHRSVLIYSIGKVYAAIGKTEEAIGYYSEAIAMDPHYSEYYNERGSLYLAESRLTEASEDYMRAISLSPPYYEVFTNLGQCYRCMGDYARAIEAYSRSLDLEPGQVLSFLGRAQAHEHMGHEGDAISDYTKALDIQPDQWEALASRGSLFYAQGDLQRAVADFNAAIQLRADQLDLHHNRSVVLSELLTRDVSALVSHRPSEEDMATLLERLAGICSIVGREMRLPS